MCAVLGSTIGGCKNIGLCPKEGKEDAEKSRKCDLGVEAEYTGLFSLEETEGSPLCCLHEGERRGRFFSAVP